MLVVDSPNKHGFDSLFQKDFFIVSFAHNFFFKKDYLSIKEDYKKAQKALEESEINFQKTEADYIRVTESILFTKNVIKNKLGPLSKAMSAVEITVKLASAKAEEILANSKEDNNLKYQEFLCLFKIFSSLRIESLSVNYFLFLSYFFS